MEEMEAYYRIRFDVHKHQCPKCKFIWEHRNISLTGATEEQYHKAHDCPKGCGINQRMRYVELNPIAEPIPPMFR